MGEEIQPTLHGEAPSGVCGRRTGDTVCGALATIHVVWRHDEAGGVVNSLCCAAHETEARREWVYGGLHPYNPACSDPRGIWLDEIDRCAVPEDALTDAERVWTDDGASPGPGPGQPDSVGPR